MGTLEFTMKESYSLFQRAYKYIPFALIFSNLHDRDCATQNRIHVFSTTFFSHYLVTIYLCFHNELNDVSTGSRIKISVASRTVDQNLTIFCPL